MLLFGLALTFFITFLTAYFNGNQVIVNINAFDEAHVELVLFSAVMIIGLILIVIKAREVRFIINEKERKD
jgi:membrane protein DedA with SNARE-associated domain